MTRLVCVFATKVDLISYTCKCATSRLYFQSMRDCVRVLMLIHNIRFRSAVKPENDLP